MDQKIHGHHHDARGPAHGHRVDRDQQHGRVVVPVEERHGSLAQDEKNRVQKLCVFRDNKREGPEGHLAALAVAGPCEAAQEVAGPVGSERGDKVWEDLCGSDD